MAVSKRLRFEILRRDDHTCLYCGAKAPVAPLRVDHVIPEALGGPTEPSNLVTACEPCNSGKSSVALDGPTVEDVRADALRMAELTRHAYAVLVQQGEDRRDYAQKFEDLWVDLYGLTVPDDWDLTLGRWHDMGVPFDLVADAADIAWRASGVFEQNRFKYMCGVLWNQVSAVSAEVSTRLALDGAWATRDDRASLEWKGFLDAVAWHGSTIDAGRVLEDFIDRASRPARRLVSSSAASLLRES